MTQQKTEQQYREVKLPLILSNRTVANVICDCYIRMMALLIYEMIMYRYKMHCCARVQNNLVS